MADVLIKGIDLPEVYGPVILKVYECIDGQATQREYKLSATQMQAILPHGRLIDEDLLIADIRKNSASYFADDFAREWTSKQPTVIEASEDSEQDE